LQYLLAHREQRLTALANLLRNFDIDLRAGLAADDPAPLLDALERWAVADWPSVYMGRWVVPNGASVYVYRDSVCDPQTWQKSNKAGADIVLSMLMDTAITLGEIVVRRRADFTWQLDLDPDNRDMTSHRRAVVMRAADAQRQWPAEVLDFEAECIGIFDWIGRGDPLTHKFGYTVQGVLAGAYDPPSKETESDVQALPKPWEMGFYDKAKYHSETVEEFGLPPERIAVPGAFFLGWVMDRKFCSATFVKRAKSEISAYRQHQITAVQVYNRMDNCLGVDLLNDEGNAFARAYFDAGACSYWHDLGDTLAPELPSVWHIEYNWERQARINARIDQRYADWNDAGRAS
jgi:hypothetical protein